VVPVLNVQRSLVGLAVGALAFAGCDPQLVQPILSPPPGDPCLNDSPADCNADTANNCTLQPNTVGCLTTDPTCALGECRGDDPYVHREGSSLLLHGKPYRFLGADQYSMAWTPCPDGAFASQVPALTAGFDGLVPMKVNAMRFFAYQSFAGASGTDYSSFDNAVEYARRAGIRLIFVLAGMQSYGCGGEADTEGTWFAGGYQNPYGNEALSFVDYVSGLVTHFRDEPTVLAWELVHEASCTSFADLWGFVSDMSQQIKAIDGNHLLSPGVDDGTSPATINTGGASSDYGQLHAIAEVDLVDIHDFNAPDAGMPANAGTDVQIAALLDKPAYFGATAVSLTDTGAASFTARASSIETKLVDALEAGAVGFLVYDYLPDWTTPGLDFDNRAAEPLAAPDGGLAQHAFPNP
jgi:hypothetical protein